jgi:hypothetical protein
VYSGRHDDVDVRLLVDPLHARDVAAQAHHGRVGDAVDAGVLERLQLPHRIRDPVLFVPPLVPVVLHHIRGEHEDVLVHQRGAQPIHGHRAAHRLDPHRQLQPSETVGCSVPL